MMARIGWRSLSVLALMVPGAVQAQDCTLADTLYERSRRSPEQRLALLTEAHEICPTHVKVINNLAVVLENRGELAKAEALYQEAVRLQPSLIAAYAGLGDVQAATGRYRNAAASYRLFLDLLKAERQTGNSSPLLKHEEAYRKRLITAQAKVDNTQVIPASEIVDALAGPAIVSQGKRGLQRRVRLPTIDTHIHFATNTDQIEEASREQLLQIAQALNASSLETFTIRIDGHTDAQGSDSYNQGLSKRRAERVRQVLIELGISETRLEALGRGESTPIASNDDAHGRALNRRVTFVNLGQR
ncbi:MAG: OmpA family protein [Magnetococcales bacterium]|nr:OmpA family protein [Magnetococcales bacterium]